MSRSRQLATLGAALDQDSWQWLNDNRPELAAAIEAETAAGADALQIRRFVMQQTERIELALRCEQAARHCLTLQG